MADFASNLGLFLGMSLFSVFEVVEFCTDMLVLICCRQIAKLEPGRKDNDNDPRESVNRTPSQVLQVLFFFVFVFIVTGLPLLVQQSPFDAVPGILLV